MSDILEESMILSSSGMVNDWLTWSRPRPIERRPKEAFSISQTGRLIGPALHAQPARLAPESYSCGTCRSVRFSRFYRTDTGRSDLLPRRALRRTSPPLAHATLITPSLPANVGSNSFLPADL